MFSTPNFFPLLHNKFRYFFLDGKHSSEVNPNWKITSQLLHDKTNMCGNLKLKLEYLSKQKLKGSEVCCHEKFGT